MNKVKEITDSKIYKQYTELKKKEQEEEMEKQNNLDDNDEEKNEKLIHINIEECFSFYVFEIIKALSVNCRNVNLTISQIF